MKVTVHVQVESEQMDVPLTEQILCLQRDELTPQNLGLTLDEGKTLLANLQTQMAQIQTEQYIERAHRAHGGDPETAKNFTHWCPKNDEIHATWGKIRGA